MEWDRKFENLTNKKFNKLTVVKLDEEKTNNNKEGKAYWWCRCDCGKMTRKSLSTSELKSNNTKSCGMCTTFEDWCIKNNREDLLERWDYELNNNTPNKITCNSGKKFYFKCLDNENHKRELKQIGVITRSINSLITCTECNSFKEWCLNNNRQDVLDRWDYELNDFLPSEILCSTHIKCYFKCTCNKHNSELKNIASFTSGQEGSITCNQCNSFAQWGIDNLGDNFIEKYWSNKNTLNPFTLSKSNSNKIYIKCQEKDYHEDYEVSCANFIKEKRCPYCINYHGKVHYKDSLGQYVVDNYGQDFLDKIWSDKNEKTAFEYSPMSQIKVWWNCIDDKHECYKREISSSIALYFRCQKCSQERKESMLQEKVRIYLESLNYGILHEGNCSIVPINPKTKYPLPFDNEIKDLKLICEVNGEQHYCISGFHKTQAKKNNTTPKQEFNYQQLKDRYKRIKAIQKGYFYLEIPYWVDDENETWKQLIDNKIKEIQENAKLNKAI